MKGNSSVNLASQGHCTRVFIGTRASNVPRQGRLCPRVPGLSQNIPIKKGYRPSLQKAITNEARNLSIHAGPVTVGRIPRGPPGEMRDAGPADFVGVWPSSCDGWNEGPVTVASRRRLRAKGSVFAFAPTVGPASSIFKYTMTCKSTVYGKQKRIIQQR
jgi:hypothetical protein